MTKREEYEKVCTDEAPYIGSGPLMLLADAALAEADEDRKWLQDANLGLQEKLRLTEAQFSQRTRQWEQTKAELQKQARDHLHAMNGMQAALSEADEKLAAQKKLTEHAWQERGIYEAMWADERRRREQAEATIERLTWMLRTYLTQHEEGMDWDYGKLPKLGSVEHRVDNTIAYLERRWEERNG